MLWKTASALVLLAGAAHAQNDGDYSPPFYPSPWAKPGTNGWQDAYQKAVAFVSQLTLLEKVNLTTGVGWEGQSCVGNTGDIPRLNFRGLCLQDSPLGVRDTDVNSAFPAGMNVAATWSTRLMKSRGQAMGAEHAGKGIDAQLGPVAGPIGRVPEGGRNWEGFSPDPVLTGVAMAQTIEGIQDSHVIATAKHYIGYEQEHYREPGPAPYAYSANIDDKTMHELYLWPFADAVHAGVGSVMASYNRINNSYGAQNSWTLNYLLKHELDFQGFVMSDWWGQLTGAASALAGLDMTMAGDQGLASGDTFWGTNLTEAVFNGTIPQWRIDDMAVRIMSAYYKVGRDTARVPVNFNSWNLSTFGYLHPEAQEDFTQINWHVNVEDDHAHLIREIGGASTVLLKNENKVLPLKKPKSIAVIGEDAHDNPAGPNACGDRGCDDYTLAMGWGSGTANFPYLISPVTAIKAQAAKDKSTVANVSDNYDLEAIAKAVTGAEVAFVFANADSGEDYITVDTNEGDRNNLTLWGNGDELARYVASLNPNTILVVHSVGAVILEEHKNNPNITAILWAGLPGQESGNALVDVVWGSVNPQGKTVFTWGKSREDYGVDVIYSFDVDSPQINFSEGLFIDYRHFDAQNITPTYEFGYGLSYTTYEYSNLQVTKLNPGPYQPTKGKTAAAPTFGTIDYNPAHNTFPEGFHKVPLYVYPYLESADITTTNPQSWPAGYNDSSPQPLLGSGGSPGGNRQIWDKMYTITADITNTGDVNGVEIVQLYLSHGCDGDPVRVLRGFDDIPLVAGETKTFSYTLTRRDLSNWDTVTQDWVITDCPKTVWVGASSRDLKFHAVLP